MSDQQYRPLAPEEIIQEGDEWFNPQTKVWSQTVIAGEPEEPQTPAESGWDYRRPIPVAKSECPKCGKESHPLLTCEQFQGVAEIVDRVVSGDEAKRQLKAIQESLSVEDESSDNSRSFQEIERLNRVIESLRKQHKNRNPTYAPCSICSHLYPEQMLVEATCSACWKLRAEKAAAELNENGKILEHLQTQRDTAYNARDGIAELYTKECELRRQAERERDEAKEKHKNIMDLWRMMKHWMIGEGPQEAFRFSDAVRQAKGDVVKTWLKIITSFWREIREIKKERNALRAENSSLKIQLENVLGSDSSTAISSIAIARLTEAILSDKPKILPDGLKRLPELLKENARFQEALEKIAKGEADQWAAIQIAQAALAGKGEK